MATHRTDPDRPEHRPQADRPDQPGRGRRAATGILGGILVVSGLGQRSVRGLAMAAVGGVLVVRALGERGRPVRSRRDQDGAGEPTTVTRSILVDADAADLYETWRDPEQLSRIVGHFADVFAPDEDRLRWTVQAPRDRQLTWETRVVAAEPGRRVTWRTPEDATVPNEWTVAFEPAPGDRGTKVTLTATFDVPGGALADLTLSQLDVVPDVVAGNALRRLKSLAETGEIQTGAANTSARGRGDVL